MDLSCSNHIEDLHEHEGGEDEGQVAGWSYFFRHLFGVKIITLEISSTARENKTGFLGPLVFLSRLGDKVLTSE